MDYNILVKGEFNGNFQGYKSGPGLINAVSLWHCFSGWDDGLRKYPEDLGYRRSLVDIGFPLTLPSPPHVYTVSLCHCFLGQDPGLTSYARSFIVILKILVTEVVRVFRILSVFWFLNTNSL